MGSSRLPNKMMLHLHGYPVIEWVCHRVVKARFLDKMVVAIPDTPLDDILALYLRQRGYQIFRGSETDVLARFFLAAREHEATHVIRVCADNPLISGEEIDNLIRFFFSHECDYAYNQGPLNNRYPDGLGAEIISFSLLDFMQQNVQLPEQREHAFNYLWDHREEFTILTFDPPDPEIAHPELKLDIDTPEDYLRFLSKDIYLDIGTRDIVALFNQ
jgi:spore coat polysaccharide biosynthesis protein SpsF